MTDTNVIFEDARTYTAWQERPVADDLLQRAYDVAKMGPTSSNCCPMRVAFVRSAEAKARLKPFLSEGNVEKTMKADDAFKGYTALLQQNTFSYFGYGIEEGEIISYYINGAYDLLVTFGKKSIDGVDCVRIQVMET